MDIKVTPEGVAKLGTTVQNFLKQFMNDRVFIEKQMLKNLTRLNVAEIKGKVVSDGKTARIKAAAPTCEAERAYLVEGHWNEVFLEQATAYPNGKHDEHPDNLGYVVHRCFLKKKRRGIKRGN